jgi:hypothetical protein
MQAWNATWTRFMFFYVIKLDYAGVNTQKNEHTFHAGQLYGSAGSADGRGSNS